MTKDEIISKLKEVLDLVLGDNISLSDLSLDKSLIDDLGLNSVGILYIVIGIEEMFNIRFTNVGFNDFKTLGDVVKYIEEKVNA